MSNKVANLLGEEWRQKLEPFIGSMQWLQMMQSLQKERQRYGENMYPPKGSDTLFKAFRTTPFSQVKVVALGQDPYHQPGVFDGFAFSNKEETLKISGSLRNIFKEVEDDVYDGMKLDQNPHLKRWAEQGVLLINVAHSVIRGKPESHLHIWEDFTEYIINLLKKADNPIVWMLWGRKAQDRYNNTSVQGNSNHLVLTAAHPSPYSADSGFFGCKHFSKCNEFLKSKNLKKINW